MSVRILTGTSGYQYAPWKGPFYPEKLATKAMLEFYASKLATVEINATFYRMPKRAVLEGWATQVPEGFSFVLKASRRITHMSRLRPETAAEPTAYLFEVAEGLGTRLGPILFQTPPNMKPDVERLRAFLELVPAGARAAFEFRHPGWFTDEVFELLAARDAALCLADTTDEGTTAPFVVTASWGYLRLRRDDYAEGDLTGWLARIRETPWSSAHVFFKHEDAGVGPRLAMRLAELARAS